MTKVYPIATTIATLILNAKTSQSTLCTLAFKSSKRGDFRNTQSNLLRPNSVYKGQTSVVTKMTTKSVSTSTSNSKDTTSDTPRFTYKLGKSLYIPLTSKCNSKSLPMTRGGSSFLKSLPKDVLTSLILVRVVEGIDTSIDFGIDDKDNNVNNTTTNSSRMHLQDLINDMDDNTKKEIDKVISSWVESDKYNNNNHNSDNHDHNHSSEESIMNEKIRKILLSSTYSKKDLDTTLSVNCHDYDEDGFHPSIESLYNEIQHNLSTPTNSNTISEIESIVFAGEGESTLRLDAILTLSKLIRINIDEKISIRVLTNGLLYYSTCYSSVVEKGEEKKEILQQMKHAGVNALSIALPTSCPRQYRQLMKPVEHFKMNHNNNGHSDGGSNGHVNTDEATIHIPHESLSQFIRDGVNSGFDVEVTGVTRDFVNQEETEKLAIDLGVKKPFRWRSYISA